jgi:hypothetical protein
LFVCLFVLRQGLTLVAQACFELTIFLTHPPESWDYRYELPLLALVFLHF